MRRSFLTVTCLLLLASARPGVALSMSPNPVLVIEGGLEVTVELLEAVAGLPAGGVVEIGDAPTEADTSLVFQITVDQLDPGAPGACECVQQFIVILGPPDGDALEPTALGTIGPFDNLGAFFTGDRFGGNVFEGERSNPVFVSYAAPLATDGSLEFTFLVVQGTIFPIGQASAILLPEPAALGLLAIAGALFGWKRRAAQR